MDPIRFNLPAIILTTLACIVLHTVIAVHEYRQSCDVRMGLFSYYFKVKKVRYNIGRFDVTDGLVYVDNRFRSPISLYFLFIDE